MSTRADRNRRAIKQESGERERVLSACHEAGHAVAMELYGPGVEFTCIDGSAGRVGPADAPGWKTGKVSGSTNYRRLPDASPWTVDDLPRVLVCTLAGPLMEHNASVHLYSRDIDPNIFNSELDAIWHHFGVTDPNIMDAGERIATERIRQLFKDPRVGAAWKEIAGALQEHGRISGDRVREIMASTEANNYNEEKQSEQASQA